MVLLLIFYNRVFTTFNIQIKQSENQLVKSGCRFCPEELRGRLKTIIETVLLFYFHFKRLDSGDLKVFWRKEWKKQGFSLVFGCQFAKVMS